MVLTLHVPPELEQRLITEAQRRNVSADCLILETLEQHLPSESERRTRAAAVWQRWIDDQAALPVQGDTGNELLQALDADRPSYRKLFPPEMKGISW